MRAAKPESVFVFYPGAAGVQFLTQYAQSGLKGQIPLYTAFTVDAITLPLQKELALGVPGAQQWVNDLPNDANKKYVADFRAKHKNYPSFYGAQSYDAVNLVNSAVMAVNGDLGKRTRCAQKCARPITLRSAVRTSMATTTSRFRISTFRTW